MPPVEPLSSARGELAQPGRVRTTKMRALIIADPGIPVPPRGYGGAERLAYVLAKGLQDAGHAVEMMAGPGSVGGWPIHAYRSPNNRSLASRAFHKSVFQFVSATHASRSDIVFAFSRLDYLWSLFRLRRPTVVRFGNPIKADDNRLLPTYSHRVKLVSVSDHQRIGIPWGDWTTIHNGLPIETFRFEADRGSYLAFLGRFHPNKGAHAAIQVALATGLPLKLAGNVPDDPECRAYFDCAIRPHLGAGV